MSLVTRFVVRELEGLNKPSVAGGNRRHFGFSCVVLDTAINYRLIREFRTEDIARSIPIHRKHAEVREAAAELADRLNEDYG